MMAVLLTACGHRASQQGEATAEDSAAVVRADEFVTNSIGQEKEDSLISVSINVEWPVKGNDSLVASIRRYICEEMAVDLTQEGEPEVKYFDDGKKAVSSTFKVKYQELKNMMADIAKNNDNPIPVDMTYSFALKVKLIEDSKNYITYLSNSEGYLGGAHGYATSTGTTFRKSDGKRIGYITKYNKAKERFETIGQTMFKDVHSKELNDLLKEGLKSYFQEFQDEPITDQDMLDQLMDVTDLSSIPLPNNAPIFTRNGLNFTYQQYEIASYAAGMPSFNIPYEKISGCLTDDAKSLIP